MAAASYGFEISSHLAAPAADVWDAVTRSEIVNYELGPWLRMTVPASARDLRIDTAPIGQRLARAWVLALGFLPIDYDDLTLVSVGPGMQFHECSPMMNCKEWVHRRSVEPEEGGCVVTDRISLEPRRLMSGRLYQAIAHRIFRHRHRRVKARFGSA